MCFHFSLLACLPHEFEYLKMTDYSEQLDALRKLSTLLTQKQEVDAKLWADAGVKPGTRLKDVNAEIASVKKKVSSQAKEDREDEEEEEIDEGSAPSRGGGHKPRGTGPDRKAGHDKKQMNLAALRGEFDLAGDRL